MLRQDLKTTHFEDGITLYSRLAVGGYSSLTQY